MIGTTYACILGGVRVYSHRTRQRQFEAAKHNALIVEHMFVNRSIETGRVASKILYNKDAVDLTLVRPVWIDPKGRRMSPLRYDRTDGN